MKQILLIAFCVLFAVACAPAATPTPAPVQVRVGYLLADLHHIAHIVAQDKDAGGGTSFYEKQGFKVDIGTHMFSRGERGPLGRLARRVGARPIPFVQPRDLSVVKGFGGELRQGGFDHGFDRCAGPQGLGRRRCDSGTDFHRVVIRPALNVLDAG